VRERAPGRWQIRAFAGNDPLTGKPRLVERTVDAANKTQAQVQLRELQASQARKQLGTSASVRTVVNEWIRHSETRGRSPRTIHEARASAEKVIFPELGDVPVSELTPRHLDEWYRKLRAGEGRARPLSAASVRRHHAVLSAALAQAVRWDWLDRNPAERARPPELPQHSLVVPTFDEVRALLDAARVENERWGMLVALALMTGARRGELCALRWTDLGGDVIRFRRSLYRAGADRGEKGTKGGRERWVSIGPVGAELLEAWRQHAAARAIEVGVELADDAFVVSPWPDGSRPVNPDTLSSAIHRICGDLGMPHVHLHSLRHFAAAELIGAGVDPRNAAELLGHANPSLTLQVYTHGSVERQRQAAGVLDRALARPPQDGSA